MSRIGKKPISIPESVKIIQSGDLIKIEGPKGKVEHKINNNFDYIIKDKILTIVPKTELTDKKIKSLFGLERMLLYNKINGVIEEYKKVLQIQGVGYRVQQQGNKLNFSLGFSHPVVYEAPQGIKVTIEEQKKEQKIIVTGIDKEKVGLVAAQIRALKKVEPYGGKGIKYEGEKVRTKVGKSAAATGAAGGAAK